MYAEKYFTRILDSYIPYINDSTSNTLILSQLGREKQNYSSA